MVVVGCSARCACRHSFAPLQRWSAGNMLKQNTQKLMFMHASPISRNDTTMGTCRHGFRLWFHSINLMKLESFSSVVIVDVVLKCGYLDLNCVWNMFIISPFHSSDACSIQLLCVLSLGNAWMASRGCINFDMCTCQKKRKSIGCLSFEEETWI